MVSAHAPITTNAAATGSSSPPRRGPRRPGPRPAERRRPGRRGPAASPPVTRSSLTGVSGAMTSDAPNAPSALDSPSSVPPLIAADVADAARRQHHDLRHRRRPLEVVDRQRPVGRASASRTAGCPSGTRRGTPGGRARDRPNRSTTAVRGRRRRRRARRSPVVRRAERRPPRRRRTAAPGRRRSRPDASPTRTGGDRSAPAAAPRTDHALERRADATPPGRASGAERGPRHAVQRAGRHDDERTVRAGDGRPAASWSASDAVASSSSRRGRGPRRLGALRPVQAVQRERARLEVLARARRPARGRAAGSGHDRRSTASSRPSRLA